MKLKDLKCGQRFRKLHRDDASLSIFTLTSSYGRYKYVNEEGDLYEDPHGDREVILVSTKAKDLKPGQFFKRHEFSGICRFVSYNDGDEFVLYDLHSKGNHGVSLRPEDEIITLDQHLHNESPGSGMFVEHTLLPTPPTALTFQDLKVGEYFTAPDTNGASMLKVGENSYFYNHILKLMCATQPGGVVRCESEVTRISAIVMSEGTIRRMPQTEIEFSRKTAKLESKIGELRQDRDRLETHNSEYSKQLSEAEYQIKKLKALNESLRSSLRDLSIGQKDKIQDPFSDDVWRKVPLKKPNAAKIYVLRFE